MSVNEIAYKITDQSLSIQKISYALIQFLKIDKHKKHLLEILNKVPFDYFVKKFRKVDFLKFCIAANDFAKVDFETVKKNS